MAVSEENKLTMSQDDFLLKFLMGNNSEFGSMLDKINNLDDETNLEEEDFTKASEQIAKFKEDADRVDELPQFSDEEKQKLKEFLKGRLDMLDMKVNDYLEKNRDRLVEYSDEDKKYYQESDVDGSYGMPNYRGLMGNRDEDGSLKPMPGKEPRK